MLERMSFDDLMWWRAFDLIEPFGDRRADYHAASICAAIYNTTLMRGGSRKRMNPTDFLLEFKDVETPDAPEQAGTPPTAGWQQMKSIAKMHFALSKALSKPKPPRPARPARPAKPTAQQLKRARSRR
jgi:hypothetical protein